MFPQAYPAQQPRYELEHNASVTLKTRAYLLRNITALLAEHAEQEPPRPSMEAVVAFLLGETSSNNAFKDMSNTPSWLTAAEADETDDDAHEEIPDLKLPPRRAGVSFAANGMLVFFGPNTGVAHGMLSAGAQSVQPSRESRSAGISGGGARFLQSYTALAGAMSSLANLAKDGVSVKDLDVVQLMGDQDFFAKRVTNQQRRSSSKTRLGITDKRASGSHLSTPADGARLNASPSVQSRLKLNSTSTSRSSSRARPSGRARSASPMHTRDARSRFRNVLSDYASTLPPSFEGQPDVAASDSRSLVFLADVSRYLGQGRPSTLFRKRSYSTPASPLQLTPRAEVSKQLGHALALPASLQNASADVPPSINASRAAGGTQGRRRDGDGDPRREPNVPPNVRIMEMSAAEAAEFLPSVVADGSGIVHDAGRSDDSDGSSDSDDDDDELTAEQLMRISGANRMSSRAESILDTMIFTIPFAFLYLMMDVMIQQQYASHPSIWTETKRMAQALPLLTALIYYTSIKPASSPSLQASKFKQAALQLLILVAGTACGCGFLYVYARSGSEVAMRRIAPLGTLWMYSSVKLDLSLLVPSLAVVYGFTKVYNLPLFD